MDINLTQLTCSTTEYEHFTTLRYLCRLLLLHKYTQLTQRGQLNSVPVAIGVDAEKTGFCHIINYLATQWLPINGLLSAC